MAKLKLRQFKDHLSQSQDCRRPTANNGKRLPPWRKPARLPQSTPPPA